MDTARDQIAELLGGDRLEVIFTASGTEANNAVLFGVAEKAGFRGHLVLSAFEHPSVARTVDRLEERGMEVTRVTPGQDGVISVTEFLDAIRPDTVLAALMLANNELGTLQPVVAISEGCRQRGVPVLCDAVQAIGKVPVNVEELGVDYLVLGGHKFHGPLGAAALWVRTGAEVESFLVGGSQERRRRASTENVPAIVGLGEACRLASEDLEERHSRLLALREAFEAGLGRVAGAIVHCTNAPRLPHTSHVAFSGVDAEALLIRLDLAGYAVSTGSACSSGSVEPSKTLIAIGLLRDEAFSSLRISFGLTNTIEEVEAFLEVLEREVPRMRELHQPAGASSPATRAASEVQGVSRA